MSIETDYENLNGEVDLSVIRQYVNAGYHLSDGAIMGLCEEIEELQSSVNAHEALVANCHNIVALAGGWDDQGATKPREPLSWETVARMAIDYARAALINAYDLPSDTTPQQLRQVQAGVLVWRGDYWEMPPATPDKAKG